MPDPFVAQLGRISGPLLAPNLIRNGIDLSFNNDLLLLKTEDFQIGINTTPTDDLTVFGTSRTTFKNSNSAIIDNNLLFQTSIISSILGPINISPDDNDPKTLIDNLIITDISYNAVIGFNENTIYSVNNNNIIFNSAATIELEANTTITENDVTTSTLRVLGNITVGGDLSTTSNIIIGDQPLDVVIINADFTQDINPGVDLSYDLGKNNKRWNNTYIDDWTKISTIRPEKAIVNNQLLIDGVTGVIQPSTTNTDLFVTAATGNILLDRIQIITNEIRNLNDTPLALTSLGIGYWKIGGTNGFVIPSGTTDQRPTNPEVGDTRWNTDLNYVECFDGNSYLLSIGPGEQISPEKMEELGNLYSLILG
jgi:hypothetical protein